MSLLVFLQSTPGTGLDGGGAVTTRSRGLWPTRSATCAPAPPTGSPTPTTPRTSCSPRRRWWCRATPPRSAGCSPPPGATGVPLTFRSGGTSLSGQAVTGGILADTRRHFRRVEVLDDGARVRVGPGRHDPAGQRPARRLRPQARPRPGQRGRVHARRRRREQLVGHGLRHRRPTATPRSSRSRSCCRPARSSTPAPRTPTPGSRRWSPSCTRASPGSATGCAATPCSRAKIEQQFSMKNTMGYGLNSFLDHTRPVDILAHLVVGSEGTLAFIAEVVMRTVPLLRARPHRAARVRRPVSAATGALPALVGTGPATIELLDATSLRVGQTDPQADALLRGLSVDRQAALLVEYQGATAADADALATEATRRARGPARSPGRARWPPTPPPGPRCGTSARASTPRSRAPARPARRRCWRTSSCRCRRCCPPASGSPRCSTGTATRTA